jgi:DUF1016 N-terminal domain
MMEQRDDEIGEGGRMGKQVMSVSRKAFPAILPEIRSLIETSRNHDAVTDNLALVNLYWNIGRIITQDILKNAKRAEYGTQLLELLASELTKEYGQGYSKINLQDMRRFHEYFQIDQTLSDQSSFGQIDQTREGENEPVGLILCSSEKRQHVELLLRHGPHKMRVSEYLTKLPDKRLLEERLKVYSRFLKADERIT